MDETMTEHTEQLAALYEAFDEDDRAELMAGIGARWGSADGWRPDSVERAAWLTSRIAHHRAEAARIKAVLQAELDRHERAADGLLRAFSADLEALARQQIAAEGGKRQKAVLPNGMALSFRKVPDSVQIDDEETVMRWAGRECPDAIITKQTLSKTMLKAWWQSTGEVAPGCTLLRDRMGFYVQG